SAFGGESSVLPQKDSELVAAIEEYIRLNNESPKPFIWHKKADEILGKPARCIAVTGTVH
ncbi:MAG: hypothetical protein Q7O66_04025, partial [Dehalococcoidia bacterium]|nr:hypothetical protein [Dehalococcoidia bacterium]